MATISIDGPTTTALIAQADHAGIAPVMLLAKAVAVIRGDEPRLLRRYATPGVYRPGVGIRDWLEHGAPSSDDGGMAKIDIDDETHKYVRFAARVSGLTEADIVARAVRLFGEHQANSARSRDPWTPVPVYAVYGRHRVEGQYLPANRRLAISTPPLLDQTFKSPSGAASAVVAALNPELHGAQRNGWRFWRLVESDDFLEVLRPGRS